MKIKKANGRIFGADFTAAERKALKLEVQKEYAEYDKKNAFELASMVLWVLYEKFGFREKRLRNFYDNFAVELKELLKRYEMDDSDKVWLCKKKLLDHGIDVEQWERELKIE